MRILFILNEAECCCDWVQQQYVPISCDLGMLTHRWCAAFEQTAMFSGLHEIAPPFRVEPAIAALFPASVRFILNQISFPSLGRMIAGLSPGQLRRLACNSQSTQFVTESRHVKAKSQCGTMAGCLCGDRWLAGIFQNSISKSTISWPATRRAMDERGPR